MPTPGGIEFELLKGRLICYLSSLWDLVKSEDLRNAIDNIIHRIANSNTPSQLVRVLHDLHLLKKALPKDLESERNVIRRFMNEIEDLL